jgi:hypothetical protein
LEPEEAKFESGNVEVHGPLRSKDIVDTVGVIFRGWWLTSTTGTIQMIVAGAGV